MITPTPRQAALERQAERYVSDWMPEWVGTMAGQRAAHMVVKALAAVEQAAPEGQNIPTIFPLGSIGASTQPPAPSISPDLADARAAIREAEIIINDLSKRLLKLDDGQNLDCAENWLALPVVVATVSGGEMMILHGKSTRLWIQVYRWHIRPGDV